MEASILKSVKYTLGIAPAYTAFDEILLIHINSTFATLNQLGIGPTNGFQITSDAATWDDYLGSDLRKISIKTYVYLCVRLLFDPPDKSYVIDSLEKQKRELEFRLNVVREDAEWVNPYPPPTVPTEP